MKPQYPTSNHFEGYNPEYMFSVGKIDVYRGGDDTTTLVGFQQGPDAWWVYQSHVERNPWFALAGWPHPSLDPKDAAEAKELSLPYLNILS